MLEIAQMRGAAVEGDQDVARFQIRMNVSVLLKTCKTKQNVAQELEHEFFSHRRFRPNLIAKSFQLCEKKKSSAKRCARVHVRGLGITSLSEQRYFENLKNCKPSAFISKNSKSLIKFPSCSFIFSSVSRSFGNSSLLMCVWFTIFTTNYWLGFAAS